jgi:large subunit ribosomal protein L4
VADPRGGSVLVVLDAEELPAAKSFRNIAGVTVLAHEDAGVADIIGAATLVASRAALDALTERARKAERKEVAA